MRIWQQDSYGPASGQHLREVPEPSGAGIVVDVHAVGLNNGDTRVMVGEPYLVRAFFGLFRPTQKTRGMDIAGVLKTTGPSFTAGDRVVGEIPGGGLAERVAVSPDRLVALPDSVSFAVAASVPVAGQTAWTALEVARLTDESAAGKRLLVLGASGGVGSFVIGLAALRGVEVTAVCRPEAVTDVTDWGAHDVRARGGADPLRHGEKFDAIIDISGDRTLRDLRRRLTDGGVAALVSGSGSRVFGPVGRILRSVFLSRASARLVPVAQKYRRDVLAQLIDLVASGKLTPRVTREYEFAEAPRALDDVAHARIIGKAVVKIHTNAE